MIKEKEVTRKGTNTRWSVIQIGQAQNNEAVIALNSYMLTDCNDDRLKINEFVKVQFFENHDGHHPGATAERRGLFFNSSHLPLLFEHIVSLVTKSRYFHCHMVRFLFLKLSLTIRTNHGHLLKIWLPRPTPESLEKDPNCLKTNSGCWLSAFLPGSILPELQPKEPYSRSNNCSDKGLMA